MSRKTPHWGTREHGGSEDDHLPLQTFIAAELPETRIFIDQLHREFTDSGRRIRIDRLIRSGGHSPWFSVTPDEDA